MSEDESYYPPKKKLMSKEEFPYIAAVNAQSGRIIANPLGPVQIANPNPYPAVSTYSTATMPTPPAPPPYTGVVIIHWTPYGDVNICNVCGASVVRSPVNGIDLTQVHQRFHNDIQARVGMPGPMGPTGPPGAPGPPGEVPYVIQEMPWKD